MKKFLKLPMSYSQVSFDDERFMKVRIKVMHNGLNLNGSVFSDDAIARAANTLSNVPLLAYTKKVDGTDEADFAGHEFEISITSDGMKYVYLGRPIGMIPESNNYSYEEDEDGRKFVFVDGYVWKDYANEALDIIQRDNGKKVSMEIKVDNYEDNDSSIEILDYKYAGVTLLGEDVQEAMMGARADIADFSADTLQEFVANFTASLKDATQPKGRPIPSTDNSQKEDGKVNPTEGSKNEEEPVLVEPVEDNPAEPEPVAISDPEPGEDMSKDDEDPVEPEPSVSKEEFEAMKKQLEEIQEAYEAIKAEKEAVEKANAESLAAIEKEKFEAELKEVVANFSDLEETEISEVVAKYDNIEDIELRLFALRGKKTVKAEERIQTFSVYDSLIPKPSAKDNKPAWASLIEQADNN